MPRWLAAPYMRAGQLVLLPDTDGDLDSEIHAVRPQTRYLPEKTRAATDALAREIPAMLSGNSGA